MKALPLLTVGALFSREPGPLWILKATSAWGFLFSPVKNKTNTTVAKRKRGREREIKETEEKFELYPREGRRESHPRFSLKQLQLRQLVVALLKRKLAVPLACTVVSCCEQGSVPLSVGLCSKLSKWRMTSFLEFFGLHSEFLFHTLPFLHLLPPQRHVSHFGRELSPGWSLWEIWMCIHCINTVSFPTPYL